MTNTNKTQMNPWPYPNEFIYPKSNPKPEQTTINPQQTVDKNQINPKIPPNKPHNKPRNTWKNTVTPEQSPIKPITTLQRYFKILSNNQELNLDFFQLFFAQFLPW